MSETQLPAHQTEQPIRPVISAGAAKRANASVRGMIIALLATVAVVIPVVLLNPYPKAANYQRSVDVPGIAAQARPVAGFVPAAPVLPAGWNANYARWNGGSAAQVPTWEVGYVTPSNQFISVVQTAAANPTWLAQQTDTAPVTGTRTVAGQSWELRDNAGANKSLILGYRGTTLVLKGAGDLTEFDVLAAAVLTSVDAGSAASPAPTGSATANTTVPANR